jgi:drug/metabolite transporter (DMT)-like permease
LILWRSGGFFSHIEHLYFLWPSYVHFPLPHLAFLKSGALMSLMANSLIGVSLVWDKVLLKRPETKDLVSYVFWLGAISIFGLVLIPFGFHMPHIGAASLGFVAGVLHLAAIYFYYAALKRGEASESLAVMGGFSPVATAVIAVFLLRQPFAGGKLTAFGLLTAGGFLMFLSEKMNFRRMVVPVTLSSLLFGLVNVLQRMVFRETNFVSGYVFFTIGTCVGALLLLVRPKWRGQIFRQSEEAPPRSRFWYFVNRLISGVGSFLIFYAISLTHPAIVDAIGGVRFAIIFVGAVLLTNLRPQWLREDFTGRELVIKTAATALVVAGMVWLAIHGGHEEAGASTAALYRITNVCTLL